MMTTKVYASSIKYICTPVILVILTAVGCSSMPIIEEASRIKIALALAYVDHGEFARGKYMLEKMQVETKEKWMIFSARAYLYEKMQNYNLAERCHSLAISSCSECPESLNNYAVFLCKRRMIKKGRSIFQMLYKNPHYLYNDQARINYTLCIKEHR
jgi:type IV pilus assembly protein PilF